MLAAVAFVSTVQALVQLGLGLLLGSSRVQREEALLGEQVLVALVSSLLLEQCHVAFVLFLSGTVLLFGCFALVVTDHFLQLVVYK